MKKVITILALTLGISYGMAATINAVPPPPTSICEVIAQVLGVEKTISPVDPEDPGHEFYKIKLRILEVSGETNPGAKPCQEAYSIDSIQEAIMLPQAYKKNPLSEGFRIKSQIAFGVCCNERIGGNFLDNIRILEETRIKRE